MKLRAKIERSNKYGVRSVKLTFPVGAAGFTPERIITRNIGPRPWSEISFWQNGQAIRIYCK